MNRKGYFVTRKNIDAETCANNDGRPVCSPSKVLCKECLEMIGPKLRAMLAKLEDRNRLDNTSKEAERR